MTLILWVVVVTYTKSTANEYLSIPSLDLKRTSRFLYKIFREINDDFVL